MNELTPCLNCGKKIHVSIKTNPAATNTEGLLRVYRLKSLWMLGRLSITR